MTHDEALECVPDVGKWQSGTCETCGAPTVWRWTGLRMVADTGDERLASKEIRHVAGDLLAASRAIEELIWEYGIGDSDRVVEPVVARFRAAIRKAEGKEKP